MDSDRIAELERKLKARTDNDGNAHSGYKANVEAIKAEIARLRQANG